MNIKLENCSGVSNRLYIRCFDRSAMYLNRMKFFMYLYVLRANGYEVNVFVQYIRIGLGN